MSNASCPGNHSMAVSLVCPACHGPLQKEPKELFCPPCGKRYPVIEGIPSFAPSDPFYETPGSGRGIGAPERVRLRRGPKKLFYGVYRHCNLALREEFYEQKLLAGRAGVVLDAGCGSGNEHYTRLGHAVGADISRAALHQARMVYPQVTQCDLEGTPFTDQTFDTVICRHVLEHLEPGKKDRVLKELYRVMKKDGVLVAGFPVNGQNALLALARRCPDAVQQQWIAGYGHLGWEGLDENLAHLVRAGFAVERVQSIYSAVWPLGEYRSHFGPAFTRHSRILRRLAAIDAWLCGRPLWFRKIFNCLLGLVSSIHDLGRSSAAATLAVVQCRRLKRN